MCLESDCFLPLTLNPMEKVYRNSAGVGSVGANGLRMHWLHDHIWRASPHSPPISTNYNTESYGNLNPDLGASVL